jgi:hypothetical protein
LARDRALQVAPHEFGAQRCHVITAVGANCAGFLQQLRCHGHFPRVRGSLADPSGRRMLRRLVHLRTSSEAQEAPPLEQRLPHLLLRKSIPALQAHKLEQRERRLDASPLPWQWSPASCSSNGPSPAAARLAPEGSCRRPLRHAKTPLIQINWAMSRRGMLISPISQPFSRRSSQFGRESS